MRNRWTKEEIWAWYNARPWVNGCNFIPATITMEEVYNPETHEAAMPIVEKEVKLAADVGLNSFRMGLPRKELWKKDPEGVLQTYENFLALLDKYGITMMPIIGNDCLNSKPDENGNSISCFDGADVIGWRPEDDMNEWADTEEFFMSFVNAHKNDERIYAWNVWNEAGNSHRNTEMISMPFLNRICYLLRAADVTQPLTADCWGLYNQIEGRYNFQVGLDPMEWVSCNLSDIISFHYYGDLLHTKAYLKFLAETFGRPMLNTEWGHRPWGSFIPSHLPLFKKYNVGSYFFGFMMGKCFDMTEVWNFIKDDDRIDTSLWMHGIYHDDFTPYDQDDIDALLEMKEILKKENAEKFGK